MVHPTVAVSRFVFRLKEFKSVCRKFCWWPIVSPSLVFSTPNDHRLSCCTATRGVMQTMAPRAASFIPGLQNGNAGLAFLSRGRRRPFDSVLRFCVSRDIHERVALYKKTLQPVEMEKALARRNVVNRIITALEYEHSYDSARRKLEGLNVHLTSGIVTLVLRSNLPVHVLWSFFCWAKTQPGFNHNEITYASMIHKLGKGQMLDAMKQIFADMRNDGTEISLVTYTAALSVYAKAHSVHDVLETWNDMKRACCQPDARACNIVMGLLMKEKRHQEALQIYKEMLESRCCPNSNTYHMLIENLVNATKLEAARSILKKMPKLGVQPLESTYNLMLKAYLKEGNHDMIPSLLSEMKETHREPRDSTMLEVIDAFKTCGKSTDGLEQEWPTFFAFKDVLNSSRDTPSTEFGSVVKSDFEFEQEDYWDEFKPYLLRKLQSWGHSAVKALESVKFKWDTSAASNILKALNNVDSALGFFEWLKCQEGYAHDRTTYTAVIRILLRNRRYEDIHRLVEETVHLQIGLRTSTLNHIIESYGANHDTSGAMKMYTKMATLGLQPNVCTFTLLISILMRHECYQQAMDVYEDMLQAGFKPTNYTYSVLIHGLGLAGKAEAGHKIFNILVDRGFQPNVITCTALIGAYAKIKNISKVMELFNGMQAAGIDPTPITYRVLAQALYEVGYVEAAKQIEQKLHHLISSGIGESVMEENRTSICNELLKSLEEVAVTSTTVS
eukprot:c25901_g1_i1 orf=514-2697(-)